LDVVGGVVMSAVGPQRREAAGQHIRRIAQPSVRPSPASHIKAPVPVLRRKTEPEAYRVRLPVDPRTPVDLAVDHAMSGKFLGPIHQGCASHGDLRYREAAGNGRVL